MHLNQAVENNNYNVFLNSSSREPSLASHYRVGFDAASTSYLSNQAVKIDVPTCKSARISVGSCSSSWKKIGNSPYAHCGRYSKKLFLLNGAMHWVTGKVIGTGDQRAMLIVSFDDIAKEKTKEIQIPSCLFDKTSMFRHERIGVLEKDLYFSVYVSGIFELWVMKDYGVVDSWTKILSIQEDMRNFRIWRALPSYNKNREILFNCSRLQGKQYESALMSYDLKNGRR
ncbi:F-box/kelch-repeat protein At3g06240-like [Papaver somniferum]|uniref:F-box/kelch-repeat protein At3g06240-like n=1 Tax=Papaver somniferum TaxID=3469 RepID=UPI000E700920|nr:F-box/kelch-repeat protein At3g06240-like [Papaver somniferum]